MHGSILHSYSVFTSLSFTVAYTINTPVQAPLFQSLSNTVTRDSWFFVIDITKCTLTLIHKQNSNGFAMHEERDTLCGYCEVQWISCHSIGHVHFSRLKEQLKGQIHSPKPCIYKPQKRWSCRCWISGQMIEI